MTDWLALMVRGLGVVRLEQRVDRLPVVRIVLDPIARIPEARSERRAEAGDVNPIISAVNEIQ